MQSPKGKGFKFAPGHGPTVPQQCPETGSGWIMGGPFWSQPLHDQAWVKGVLDTLTVITTPTSAQADLSWVLRDKALRLCSPQLQCGAKILIVGQTLLISSWVFRGLFGLCNPIFFTFTGQVCLG